jgi:hypothetical protein
LDIINVWFISMPSLLPGELVRAQVAGIPIQVKLALETAQSPNRCCMHLANHDDFQPVAVACDVRTGTHHCCLDSCARSAKAELGGGPVRSRSCSRNYPH